MEGRRSGAHASRLAYCLPFSANDSSGEESTTLRLLHLADLHLGVESFGHFDPATGLNSRLLDFTARLDEAIDHAIETRVDLVLFAGDAYKSRDPSPTHQRELSRRIRRLADAGIPTFLLVGNHDLPAATGRANSLDIYDTLAVPGITIGRTPTVHRIETAAGAVQIVALPWLRRSALLTLPEHRALSHDDARRKLEETAAEFIGKAVASLDRSLPAILTAHLSVEGATYGSERNVLVGEDISLPRSSVCDPAFSYVALGHIHKHQVLNQHPLCVYPGSLERVDFGEEHDPKGFVTVDIDGLEATYQFHPVAARRFVTVRVKATGDAPTEAVVREIERASVADAVVRLIVESEPEVDARIDYAEVRRALRDAYAIAGIRREVRRLDRRRGPEGIESMTPVDALDAYLASRDVAEERRALLRRYASALLGEAP